MEAVKPPRRVRRAKVDDSQSGRAGGAMPFVYQRDEKIGPKRTACCMVCELRKIITAYIWRWDFLILNADR